MFGKMALAIFPIERDGVPDLEIRQDSPSHPGVNRADGLAQADRYFRLGEIPLGLILGVRNRALSVSGIRQRFKC